MVVVEKTRHNVSPLRWFVENILPFLVFFKLLYLFLSATYKYSSRSSIRHESAWASNRRVAPAALLMSLERSSYC